MNATATTSKKMSSENFAGFVANLADLYDLTKRNGFYVPIKTSSAINELMLVNILHGNYWCPKYQDLKLKPCVKPPVKAVLVEKLKEQCLLENYNVAWIDETHLPDSKWLVDVLATLKPDDEIFRKNYVAPPVRKRLREVETITLPDELFEGLPKTKRKVKARRLKIMSEAFA